MWRHIYSHPTHEYIILLIGPLGSEKDSFLRKSKGGFDWPSWLRRPTHGVRAVRVNVQGRRVTLLDTPDVGSIVNGREVVERNIAEQTKDWLRR